MLQAAVPPKTGLAAYESKSCVLSAQVFANLLRIAPWIQRRVSFIECGAGAAALMSVFSRFDVS